MENQLILLRKQIHIVSKDLEEIADSMSDNRLYDICRRQVLSTSDILIISLTMRKSTFKIDRTVHTYLETLTEGYNA